MLAKADGVCDAGRLRRGPQLFMLWNVAIDHRGAARHYAREYLRLGVSDLLQ